MKNLEKKTQDIYNKNAIAFDQQRSKNLFEKAWLDKFLSRLNRGDEVLDVGCGAGEPIAKYLIEKEMIVTGIDFSHEMIKIVSQRFPEHSWLLRDMRNFSFKKKFKGIIAWDSFFHLNHEDQVSAFSQFDACLEEGGVVMLTVGDERGEVVGHVNGDQIYHSSLSPKEYQDLLKQFNYKLIEFVPNDPHCNGRTVLFAEKIKT